MPSPPPRKIATADLTSTSLTTDVKALIIEPDADGFLLIRLGPARQFMGDTFHPTIGAAKSQAFHEFDLPVDAWRESALNSP